MSARGLATWAWAAGWALVWAGVHAGGARAETISESTDTADGVGTVPTYVVDEIEIDGVTVFSDDAIASTVEFAPGEPLARQRVVATVKNIQEMYRRHGYEEVEVKAELLRRPGTGSGAETQTVISFGVKEGLPSRVARISVVPREAAPPGQTSAYLTQRQPEIIGDLSLQVGDVFDQDRLNVVKREVEAYLSRQEFFDASVTNVRVRPSKEPLLQTLQGRPQKAARWLSLDFEVDLGERVTFAFKGNRRLNRGELMAVVEEQRAIGFGEGYVDDIRARVVERYRAIGYANADARASPVREGEHERSVTYEITEGERVRLDTVGFEGQTVFDETVLRGWFFEKAPSLIQRRIYSERDLQSAADLLIQTLKSQGYLSAKVVSLNRAFSEDRGRVDVVVRIFEGERTQVRLIELQGLKLFSQPEVLGMLGVEEGKPLNLFALNEGLDRLKIAYRNRGYLGFHVVNEEGVAESDTVVRYREGNRQADVVLVCEEGPQYRVSRIVLEGLTKTKSWIVQRELRFREGDILTDLNIAESEGRIRKLGIFTSVAIVPLDDPNRPGFKVTRVHVEEGEPGFVGGGPGFRNDLGVRLFGEAGYSNLWRRNHSLVLSGAINRRLEDYDPGIGFEYQAAAAYTWPWFIADEMSFRPEVSTFKRKYAKFSAVSTALKTSVDRFVIRSPFVGASLTHSLERTRQFITEAQEGSDIRRTFDPAIDGQTLLIGALIPSMRLDYRDNPLTPGRGLFSTASYELADRAFGSQVEPFEVGYWRLQTRTDLFIPLPLGVSVYFSFRYGFERNNIDPRTTNVPPSCPVQNGVAGCIGIPLIKQFTLGGVSTIRGYGLQEINFQDKVIQGTLDYVNTRTQIDIPIVGSMRFGPFFDAGELVTDRACEGGGVLEGCSARRKEGYGTGVGIHYMTPIGPVNFDWGFRLKKLREKANEDTNLFYFSVGVL